MGRFADEARDWADGVVKLRELWGADMAIDAAINYIRSIADLIERLESETEIGPG